MKIFGKRNVVIAAVVAVGLAVTPAISASATADTGNVYKACGSAPVPYLQVQSTATGHVNHMLDGNVLGSWSNGSTSQSHFSPTNVKAGNYRVYLTGVGGNITYATAVCHS